LDILKHEANVANSSPHLRKKHLPRPDIVDNLDRAAFSPYHHEGPYDATLLARNLSPIHSPIEATKYGNAEALKATPRENIQDSLEQHRPLDGIASIPPGMEDHAGHLIDYEEGSNMMIEHGGDFKRWPGVVNVVTFYSTSKANCIRPIFPEM
jgi:hypothetical protein